MAMFRRRQSLVYASPTPERQASPQPERRASPQPERPASPQPDFGFHTDEAVARAVLTPAVSTMVADGDVSEFETTQIANLCAFSPIYLPLGGERVQRMIGEIINEIGSKGHPETIKQAASRLSPPLRETALCFAMRVALADGHINENEKNSLSQTGYYMDIKEEVFERILSVVAMMQRPAAA